MIKVNRPKQSVNVSHEGLYTENAKYYNIEELIKEHPEPDVWVDHIENDLMKFWSSEDARKIEKGLFHTYRSNKGEIFDSENCCTA